MPVGTRILLAVITIFIGVLVVYYGFVMPEDPPSGSDETARLAEEPPTADPGSEAPVVTAEPTARDVLRDEAATSGDARASTASVPVLPREQPTLPPPVGDPAPRSQRSETAAILGAPAGDPPPIGRQTPEPKSDASSPPAATPAATQAPAPQYTMYTVDDGDTMSSIAAWWFGDENKWDLIAKVNLVDPNRLRIGQQLRLPARDARRRPIERREGGAVHEVRAGDTLVSIARTYLGRAALWESIYDANRELIGPDSDALEVGMKLRIPAGSADR